MPVSLTCAIEPVADGYRLGDPVAVRGILTNTGDGTVQLLTWNTFLEGQVKGEFAEIVHNDRTVAYDGARRRGTRPARSRYLRLEPGESAGRSVDLSSAYAFAEPGTYRIRFNLAIQDVFVEGERERTALPVASDWITIELEAAGGAIPTAGQVARSRLAEPLVAAGSTATAMAGSLPSSPKKPAFQGGTSDQQTQLASAHYNAYKAILAAYNSTDLLTGGTLYRRWFGAVTDARRLQVIANYAAMAKWMANNTIIYDCHCFSSNGCDDPAGNCCDWDEEAYTYTGTNVLYACSSLFWSITSIEEQAETIVHEISHQAVGTDDFWMTETATIAYAMANPDGAVNNAYSYGYFAGQEWVGPDPSDSGPWTGSDHQLGDLTHMSPACAASSAATSIVLVYQDDRAPKSSYLWTRYATFDDDGNPDWKASTSHVVLSPDGKTKYVTLASPALAEAGGSFYCAFLQGDAGQPGYQGLVLTSSADNGASWTALTSLGIPTAGAGAPDLTMGPALASDGTTLHCVYVDTTGALYYLYRAIENSTGWSTAAPVNFYASTSPALCVFQNVVYLAYFVGTTTFTLRVTSLSSLKTWTSEQVFWLNKSSSGPTMAAWNTTPPRLVVPYRGLAPDSNLRDFAFDGSRWDQTDYRESGCRSLVGPAITSYGTNMYATYMGGDPKSHHIYWGMTKTSS